jgi:hypothetical protein
MFRLLALGTMLGIGIGAYKFFSKKKNSSSDEQQNVSCEQEVC